MKLKSPKTIVPVLALLSPALAGFASAAVSLDVNGSYTGSSVLDTNSHAWVSVVNGTTFAMDSQTVTFNRSSWFSGSIGSPAIPLFGSYLHNNDAGAQTFSLSGLDLTKTYDIVIFSAQSPSNRGGTFALVTGTNPSPLDIQSTTGDQQDTFAAGVNYIRFDNITPAAGGTIGFSATSGSEGINIFNGLAIQSVPEPASALLGSLGLLALLRRRR